MKLGQEATGRPSDRKRQAPLGEIASAVETLAHAKALGTFVREVRGPATELPDKEERGEQGA